MSVYLLRKDVICRNQKMFKQEILTSGFSLNFLALKRVGVWSEKFANKRIPEISEPLSVHPLNCGVDIFARESEQDGIDNEKNEKEEKKMKNSISSIKRRTHKRELAESNFSSDEFI